MAAFFFVGLGDWAERTQGKAFVLLTPSFVIGLSIVVLIVGEQQKALVNKFSRNGGKR